MRKTLFIACCRRQRNAALLHQLSARLSIIPAGPDEILPRRRGVRPRSSQSKPHDKTRDRCCSYPARLYARKHRLACIYHQWQFQLNSQLNHFSKAFLHVQNGSALGNAPSVVATCGNPICWGTYLGGFSTYSLWYSSISSRSWNKSTSSLFLMLVLWKSLYPM